MKFSYKFSNLLGTVYKSGDILFSNDGNTVICPVGNKISLYDLNNNRARTLPIEARFNYTSLALSPNGRILVAAVEDGELHIINLNYRNILYRKRFNGRIKSIKFSPNGKHFAITKDNSVFVYNSPSCSRQIFDPFSLERVYHSSYDETTCIDWSFDSRLLAFGSLDMTVHVCAFTKFENLRDYSIGGNKDSIVGVFFEGDSYDLCTVSKNGHINVWECSVDPEDMMVKKDIFKREIKKEPIGEDTDTLVEDEFPLTQEELEGQGKENKNKEVEKTKTNVFYKRKIRLFLDTFLGGRNVTVTASNYKKETRILLVGLSMGDFLLLDLNDKGSLIHSLNISKEVITGCAINSSGEWIALGVSSHGQLLVWEWQSETHILKQQGHYSDMNVVTYSPDGLQLATGGEDGKVKLWSSQSSFCYLTFTEHTGSITGVAFTQSGKAVISSSLDGTVRAFDLTRYRNFKTLTSPRPVQFSCLAVDSSGELVCAGGQDVHEIFLWSLQTGRLLEILGGHTGPVVGLQFSPQPGSTTLVSTAWDKTAKVWDAIANTTAKETIPLLSDGTCVSIRLDGNQISVGTMDGQITMFNRSTCQQEANIEGKNDLGAGRSDSDKVTAKTNLKSKSFTSICYSTDGKFVLAAGQSKNICIYSIEDELLIKKFEITQNRSFEAMDEIISRKKIAENGINLALIEDRDSDQRVKIKVPGLRKGDMSLRTFNPEVRVNCLTFSPTGRSWAACTSEGLLIYSLDDDWLFDPLELDEANTPAAVRRKLVDKDYSVALMMAIRLNIKKLIQEVLESVPVKIVSIVVGSLAQLYVESLLKFLGSLLESTRHVGLYTHWINNLVTQHGQVIKSRSPNIIPILNELQKSLTTHFNNLSKVCSHNEYMLKYLLAQSALQRKRKPLNSTEIQELSFDDDLNMDSDDETDLVIKL